MKKLFLFLILVMSVIFGYGAIKGEQYPCPGSNYKYYYDTPMTGTKFWLIVYVQGTIFQGQGTDTIYVHWNDTISNDHIEFYLNGQSLFNHPIFIHNPPTPWITGESSTTPPDSVCINNIFLYELHYLQFGIPPITINNDDSSSFNWNVIGGTWTPYGYGTPNIDYSKILVTWNNSGVGVISISFIYNCPTDTTYLQVKVNPQPSIIITDSIISIFDTSHFESNLNTFGNYNWVIQKQDSLNPNSGFQILDSIPYTNKLNVQWVDTGKYTASLHFDSCGLNNVSVDTILVTLDNIVSIFQNNKEDIVIYPNPVQDKLFFRNIDEDSEILIYNLNGELLIKKYNTLNYIEVKDLYSGIYIIKIYSSQKVITKRFCKM